MDQISRSQNSLASQAANQATQPVIIYISAASDLIPERDTVARLIAELPVTLPWRILLSPLSAADTLELEGLQQADLYFLIMGTDIRAPIGLEWRTAQLAYRQSIPLLKRGVPRTPAGQNFIHEVNVDWQPFTNPAELRSQVQQVLVKHLLHFQREYTLTRTEVEQLNLSLTTEPAPPETATTQDAGHSAVILSRERYEPRDGILINDE